MTTNIDLADHCKIIYPVWTWAGGHVSNLLQKPLSRASKKWPRTKKVISVKIAVPDLPSGPGSVLIAKTGIP
jgi:hypothetical protein